LEEARDERELKEEEVNELKEEEPGAGEDDLVRWCSGGVDAEVVGVDDDVLLLGADSDRDPAIGIPLTLLFVLLVAFALDDDDDDDDDDGAADGAFGDTGDGRPPPLFDESDEDKDEESCKGCCWVCDAWIKDKTDVSGTSMMLFLSVSKKIRNVAELESLASISGYDCTMVMDLRGWVGWGI
jgi:hypothetical protein